MKDSFPGHFKLTSEEINNLWQNAIFTVDANILLNLYRYSDETRENYFKILNKIKDRVWIPYQAAQEFFNNRLNVINQQEKSYDEAISALNTIEEDFKNSRQHPFIDNKLLVKFTALSGEICELLTKNKKYHSKRVLDDDILTKIQKLFDKKVGNEYDEETLNKLYKEAEQRSSKKIPPGYMDSNKKEESSNSIRKYGDYIVWKQIIDKANESNSSIIFVTDDRKEDWWLRFKGKTLSPRPELIKEFRREAKQFFYMYQSDRFLEFARDYLNEEIKQSTLEEIRELRKYQEKIHIDEKGIKVNDVDAINRREQLIQIKEGIEEDMKVLVDIKQRKQDSLQTQHSNTGSINIRLKNEIERLEMMIGEKRKQLSEIYYRGEFVEFINFDEEL